MVRLITIRFSHYCEKARWALDRAGVPYEEQMHLPIFAWGPALRAARKRTVPALVSDGKRLPDSTDILRWIDGDSGQLYPAEHEREVADWEEQFDRQLGPATRRIAYAHLSPEAAAELFAMDGPPAWERALGRLARPFIVKTIRYGLKVDDAGVERSKKTVERVFAAVAERIADGRRYLVGERFTAADLTFAALCQPILYARPFQKFVVTEDRLPPSLLELVQRYRATPAGRFAMRLYEERNDSQMRSAHSRSDSLG